MNNVINMGTLGPVACALALVSAGCWAAWEALRRS